ncbi:MAG: DUF2194 domain-containing protein [Eubacteriales bacterium]
MKDVQKRIAVNIIIIAVIAVGLIFVAHDFFKESDMRGNIELNEIEASVDTPSQALEDERIYYVVYQESSEVAGKIAAGYTHVLDTIKVHYELLPAETFKTQKFEEKDQIIFIVESWRDYETVVNDVLSAAQNGSSLILGYAPGNDTLFKEKMEAFGITGLGEYQFCASLVVKGDMLLGLHPGDVLTDVITEDAIYVLETTDDAKVFLTDENGIPIYYTIDYGKGRIGVYNGENTYERYYAGVVIGILGTMSDGIAYPIINAGVVFIDDWPGPLRGEEEIIATQYGMDLDGFLRYIWWPDMQEMYSKYGVIYTGQFVLTYNDIQAPPFDLGKAEMDVPMYSFGQQVMESQGEVGLHGYNHQPLWFTDYVSEDYDGYYEPWQTKEDALKALNYALAQWETVFPYYKLNSYVPPSNIIDETGIEVVKEVLGTPVIISGLYIGEPPQMPSFDFEIDDGAIYFPRMTAGYFLDDETKLQMELGAGLFGVVSHFLHPDDVIDPNRNRGYTWEQLNDEYDSMIAYITERYPFISFTTLTNASNTMIDWCNIDYHVVYGDEGIAVTTENYEKPFAMILLSDRPIKVQGDGYSVQRLGGNKYYIEIKSASVTFDYSEGN